MDGGAKRETKFMLGAWRFKKKGAIVNKIA